MGPPPYQITDTFRRLFIQTVSRMFTLVLSLLFVVSHLVQSSWTHVHLRLGETSVHLKSWTSWSRPRQEILLLFPGTTIVRILVFGFPSDSKFFFSPLLRREGGGGTGPLDRWWMRDKTMYTHETYEVPYLKPKRSTFSTPLVYVHLHWDELRWLELTSPQWLALRRTRIFTNSSS